MTKPSTQSLNKTTSIAANDNSANLSSQSSSNRFPEIDLNQKVISLEEVRNQQQPAQELQISITKDPALLNEYYKLRHDAFHDENGWGFDDFENEFDRQGHIIVAIKNGQLVGGMRLMFSDECEFFSNEVPGTKYLYKNVIPKEEQKKNLIVSEGSALVVKKGERNSLVATALLDFLLKQSKIRQCGYLFAVATLATCINYKREIKRIGYDTRIEIEFPWQKQKGYNFLESFPMYLKFY